MAAQFCATNGPLALELWLWSDWAKSSFPVPVSPQMSTGEVLAATRWTVSLSVSISGFWVMMSSSRNSPLCGLASQWFFPSN